MSHPTPAGRVLVTTPSFAAYSEAPLKAAEEEGLEIVRAQGTHPLNAEQLRAELSGFDALITGLDPVTEAVLEGSPELRVVAKHGVGVDNIDVGAADQRGITVVNAPGANSDAVADLTLGLILAASRRILEADASMRRQEWGRFAGRQLHGQRLGVIGIGKIGSAVAHRAKAFGMEVVSFDPFHTDGHFERRGVQRVDLETLVATSDVITLHIPFEPGSAPLLTAELLRQTKPGVGIVNAARGGVLDEAELAALLHAGHVSFAAADAFAVEPPPADAPLMSAPRTILSPHIGAYTDLANAAMGELIVRDIARVLRGESPENPVHEHPAVRSAL